MPLPSSPPPLPILDLPFPSSPPLPHKNLKRQLSDYASSDAVFSDTPSDAEEMRGDGSSGEEGEGMRKRKKIVRGPWWNVRRRSGIGGARREINGFGDEARVKRKKIRCYDSGVWMLSSDADSDCMPSCDGAVVEEEEEDPIPSSPEALAVSLIHDCLDSGREIIDLSGLDLTSLSNITLRPLHQLIRHTHTELIQPPSETEFLPLTPSIQIFLARNALTSLPAELFRLENLTVLSLRANLLERLPPTIERLVGLKELNVSGNRLKWLPWEMLGLMRCRGWHRQVTVRPNPGLVECGVEWGVEPEAEAEAEMEESTVVVIGDGDDGDDPWTTYRQIRAAHERNGSFTMRKEMELRLQLGRALRLQHNTVSGSHEGEVLNICREELIYLASSSIQYLDVRGTPLSPTSPTFNAVLSPDLPSSHPDLPSTTPSLFELSLRKFQSNYDITSSPLLDSESDIPPLISTALRRAAQNAAEFGNEKCSSCGRGFVVARAQWVEFWWCGFPAQELREGTRDEVLPFLRRACSWGCISVGEGGNGVVGVEGVMG